MSAEFHSLSIFLDPIYHLYHTRYHFLARSICRLEWKPLFWKSLSHTHSYSPITVESDFNNPLYEAGVSEPLRIEIELTFDFLVAIRSFVKHFSLDMSLFFPHRRIRGSTKCPFEGEQPDWDEGEDTKSFTFFGEHERPHSPFLTLIFKTLYFRCTVSDPGFFIVEVLSVDLLHWCGGVVSHTWLRLHGLMSVL